MTDEQTQSLDQIRELARNTLGSLGRLLEALKKLQTQTDPKLLRHQLSAFKNARGVITGDAIEDAIVAYERTLSPTEITLDDLVFAASLKCECGAPMAFIRKTHRLHLPHWECSQKLLAIAANAPHTGPIGFDFLHLKQAS